ncbi:MAG: CRTAC1 family protein [Planctomycetota bacterium]
MSIEESEPKPEDPSLKKPADIENREQDDDVQNDEAIAVAFRRSLVVIALIGVVFAGIVLTQISSRSEPQKVEKEVTVPTNREVVAEESVPRIPWTRVTDSCGIDFVHRSGRAGQKLLPETMGSGVAVLDFDGDGHQDLFFVNSRPWSWDEPTQEQLDQSYCRLYRGRGDFSFEDVSESTGLVSAIGDPIYGMGVAVGDIDNDGDPDLYVTAVGPNVLLRNDGGTFVNVTDSSGLAGGDEDWGTSCGFADIDNDGLLDLFVANYVAWDRDSDLSQSFTLDGKNRAYGPPRAFSGAFSSLYRNAGDGTFVDITAAAGIEIRNDDTNVPLGKAMGLSPVDFNRDGWMDLVVANDTVRNFLLENNRDGTFTEMGRIAGIAFDRATGSARGAMGIDSAIFRGGDTLAVAIGNFANEPSALYMAASGRKQFIDAAMFTGFGPPTRRALTFGTFFFDADLDGRLDVFGANGHLEDEISKTQNSQTFEQPPQLFWNAGREASSELMLADAECVGEDFLQPVVGRAAAFGDFDEDGDLDVVITVNDGPPTILRNDQKVGNRHLRISLQGTRCNRDAIGATISLELDDKTLVRTLMPTRSYLSQTQRDVFFGLGKDAIIESIEIQWPGSGGEPGETQAVPVEGIGSLLQVVQEG